MLWKYLRLNIWFRNSRMKEYIVNKYLEYPEEALREAIINSIIHKDYLGPHIQLRVGPEN